MRPPLPPAVVFGHAFLTASFGALGLALFIPAFVKWLRLRKVYAGTSAYDHRHLYIALLGLWLVGGAVLWYVRFFVPLGEALVWIAAGVPIFAAIYILARQRRLPSQRGLERDRDEHMLDV
jgi:Na+/melibiose symporter-like transporter